MSLINTGVGNVTGVVASTDNALMRWDGNTGELAEDSLATLNDVGDLTAVKFIGDGSLLTNIPGGDGTGDVVGPLVSIDFRVPTFDGITGRLLRQSPVTISNTGAILGVTSFSVDNVFINGQIVEAAINTNLELQATGSGNIELQNIDSGWITLNGVRVFQSGNIDSVDTLTLNGDLWMNNGDQFITGRVEAKIPSNGVGFLAVGASTTASVGLRVKQGTINTSTIIDFHNEKATGSRKGWFGFGSSGDRNLMGIHNDAGAITITPRDSSGIITMTGYTKLGDTINHPEIKIKMIKGTTSSSSTGSITISHGLSSTRIISIQGIINHVTGRGIPPGYEAGGGSFDWDFWYDATNVHIINAGSSIAGKPVNVLVTYIK